MSSLNLTPLQSALRQLQEGINEAEKNPQSEIVRDGVIQRFEYSHELALKFMKRVLETVHGDPVDQFSFNELLRTAAERGYIENVEAWLTFRKMCNQSSHTYDQSIAALVFAQAKPFLLCANILLKNLEERQS